MQHSSLHGSGLAHLLQSPEANTLNLTVLRRIDPTISQVLACANHVALYNFDRSQHRWVRKDVEGSFFLIQRTLQPFHQIVILNKKSADNYVEDIIPDLSFELTLPYIMYRNTADEVVGVWFYEEAEARKVAALLQQISAQNKALGHTAKLDSLAQQMDTQSTSPSTGPLRVNSTSMADQDPQHTRDGELWDRAASQPVAKHNQLLTACLQPHGSTGDPAQSLQSATITSEPGKAQDGGRAMSEPNALEKLFARLKVPDSLQAPVGQTVPLLPSSAAGTTEYVDIGRLSSGQACAPVMAGHTVMPVPPLFKATSPLLHAVMKAVHDDISMSPAAPPPQPPRPTLLTPKYLAAAQVQPRSPAAVPLQAAEHGAKASDVHASDVTLLPQMVQKDEESLSRFFMRNSNPAAAQSPAPHPDASAKRERLRKALAVLAQSDAFVDILLEELSSAGLLA